MQVPVYCSFDSAAGNTPFDLIFSIHKGMTVRKRTAYGIMYVLRSAVGVRSRVSKAARSVALRQEKGNETKKYINSGICRKHIGNAEIKSCLPLRCNASYTRYSILYFNRKVKDFLHIFVLRQFPNGLSQENAEFVTEYGRFPL